MMTHPAGWYPDTTQPGTDRYWDGNGWTDDRRPGSVTMAPQQQFVQAVVVVDPRPISGLGITGFVLSLIFALGWASIVGLVFSIFGMRETNGPQAPKKGRGLTVAGLVINIIGSVFWVIFAGAPLLLLLIGAITGGNSTT